MDVSVEFDQSSRLPTRQSEKSQAPAFLRNLWQKRRTHHYQACAVESSFMLEESSDNAQEFCMTAQKVGVKQGDYVKIHSASSSTIYTVLEIDYFSGWSEMWMARLAVVTEY